MSVTHHLPPFKRSLCALLCLAALSALPPALHAAESAAAAVQAGTRSIDIGPGPLSEVLARYAASAGVALSFDAASLRQIQSPGLKGNYTAQQGFDRLLAGSGLEAVQTSTGNFALKKLPVAQGETTLTPMMVTAQAGRDGTTEGSGSYRATYTNTATKLNLSPRETPQTVTVITRQQMDDFGMTSVDDALKAVSGVFVASQGVVGGDYYSRGFALQSQYDGIPNPSGIGESEKNPQIDNAFLDRVEVLQGASGLLTGAGNPGGTINLVRKRPTETFQGQAEVQLGSWNKRRAVGDISGPLIESGRIRGRLVAVAENSDSFVDYAYKNKRGAYGIVEADLTETTMLSASIQYQKETARNHFGVPFAADGSDAGLSRSSFFGDPKNREEKDYTLSTVELTQKLAADWRLKASYMHGQTNVKGLNNSYVWGDLDVTTGDGMSIDQNKLFQKRASTNALDVYASGPVSFWGRTHELAFGLNGYKENTRSSSSGWTASTPINVYTFNPNALVDPTIGSGFSSATNISQLGIYGVGRFSLTDSLKLIAGTRFSNYENKDPTTGTTNQKESSVVSPYAGLIYDINRQYSAYISYSDIFTPQSYKGADGSTLKPVVGANYEAGIKGELFERRLNVSAAVFQLVQSNLAKVDASAGPTACSGDYCYVAQDKVRSEGIELGANGEIMPGWHLAAGYTYVNSKYASGTNDGQRYKTNLPQHSLRLATNYKLPHTDWTLGGSLAAYSKAYLSDVSWVSGNPWTIRQGGFALVGLNAKYQIDPKTELTVAVNNLFDRTYRAYLVSRDYSVYGDPRNLTVNLRYRF